MRGTGEIERNIVSDRPNWPGGWRRITAAPDKSWYTISNDGPDGGEITMLDGFESCLFATTERGIYQQDICIFTALNKA